MVDSVLGVPLIDTHLSAKQTVWTEQVSLCRTNLDVCALFQVGQKGVNSNSREAQMGVHSVDRNHPCPNVQFWVHDHPPRGRVKRCLTSAPMAVPLFGTPFWLGLKANQRTPATFVWPDFS